MSYTMQGGELVLNMRITVASKGSNDYVSCDAVGLVADISDVSKKDACGTLSSPYVKRISIKNNTDAEWCGVIHIERVFDKNSSLFYMPGFMYGSNRGEAPIDVDAKFPRIRKDMHMPASPWWMVRSDRLSHPVVFAYDSGKMYGITAQPYYTNGDNFIQYGGFTCSAEDGSIGYTIGYENAPWFFLQSHNVYDRTVIDKNGYTLSPGESVEADIVLYEYPAEDEREIYTALEPIYNMYHEAPRKASDGHTTIADISKAVSRDSWIEADKAYSGFVFEQEDGSFTYNKLPSISWTNGMAVALPMLLSSYRVNDETMYNQAVTFIDNLVGNSLNKLSGLPYDSCHDGVWSNRGWWYERLWSPGHSSYLVGQALYYICKAYEYEKRFNNISRDDWMQFVADIIPRIEKTKNTDDEYPYILSAKTGAGIEYDSFAGAWCMAATAYYSVLNHDLTYLDGLKKSEKHYYDEYIKCVSVYGAPLDTDKAVDSEGVLAYIRALRFIHTLTNDDIYLDHMRDALCYEFTFKFCYNSPVKVPPLSKMGWSSCGGSITSVANPHIHPMSSTVTDEMLYYATKREDEYVKSRLNDTLLWGCQTYNTYDKEYDYGLKGWMSERFCHSEGLLTEKYPDGSPASTWFALMPWACGCILESLAGECYEYIIDNKII